MTVDPQAALPAAQAAAAVLPSVEPLTALAAQRGSAQVTADFAGAAVADLEGGPTGAVAVLVGADLVAALAASPLGGLDLAAAVQPALDAAATTLGARAGAARVSDLDVVATLLGPSFTVVPLAGTGIAAAVLVADSALTAAAATPGATPPFAASTDGPFGDSLPTPEPATATASNVAPLGRGIEMLHGVIMDVTVELGRTRMSVRDLLALTPGTVLELDRAAGSPADLLVNGRLIARGEVVVVDEDFGLRVTEIVDSAQPSKTA